MADFSAWGAPSPGRDQKASRARQLGGPLLRVRGRLPSTEPAPSVPSPSDLRSGRESKVSLEGVFSGAPRREVVVASVPLEAFRVKL